MSQEPKSLKYKVGRLFIAGLIVIVIFSFSPYDSSNIKVIYNSVSLLKTDDDFLKAGMKASEELEATFPGGKKDLELMINKAVDLAGINTTGADSVTTCSMKITVDAGGVVKDAITTSQSHPDITDIAVKAVQEGPQWRPAIIDGAPVESIIEQTVAISLTHPDEVKIILNH